MQIVCGISTIKGNKGEGVVGIDPEVFRRSLPCVASEVALNLISTCNYHSEGKTPQTT